MFATIVAARQTTRIATRTAGLRVAYATIANPIPLPPLPYEKHALEPHVSRETLEYHYEKHHRGYVNKLNSQLEGSERDLPTLIKTLSGQNFNLAAQIYNHTFYWESMKPNGGGAPTGKIADAINKQWGSFDNFKDEFNKTGAGVFGSGWVWLVQEADGSLQIVGTSNAFCPIRDGQKPILTCDVWEHAYYIDYRHDRPKYLSTWWNVVNWDFASANL